MSSHKIIPKEYTSESSSTLSFLNASGDIHSGVPPAVSNSGLDFCKYALYLIRLMPKSEIFKFHFESTNKFAGFKS